MTAAQPITNCQHQNELTLDAERMMSASYCPMVAFSSSGDRPSLVVTLPKARSRSRPDAGLRQNGDGGGMTAWVFGPFAHAR